MSLQVLAKFEQSDVSGKKKVNDDLKVKDEVWIFIDTQQKDLELLFGSFEIWEFHKK